MAKKLDKEQFEILKKHKFLWDQFRKDGTMINLTYDVKKELENIHIDLTGRTVNLYCNQCLIDMVRVLFAAFDSYAEELPVLPKEEKEKLNKDKKNKKK
jgi:hypothetical protein